MQDFNFLLLPMLAAMLIGLVVGIRGRRGFGWVALNVIVSGFMAGLVIGVILLAFLVAPAASPGFADWMRNNGWFEAVAMAALVLLPMVVALLSVLLLRRMDAR